ncbi:hypothetical protein [Leptolyngbya sp. FACHB-17]|nr:hypothetical protein [Leptolyngbya sp. FACHB-17]MBD2079283.1 hypothetical protein [Leptolyngbya sp. FACHB-17]
MYSFRACGTEEAQIIGAAIAKAEKPPQHWGRQPVQVRSTNPIWEP